jgi:hypothetical protein
MKILKKGICLLFLTSLATSSISADQGDVYLGLQFPGISLKYDMTDTLNVQGMAGVYGDLSMYTARTNYKFKREKSYDLYGYGEAGLIQWDGGGSLFASESVPTFGAGAGIEWSLSKVLGNDLPLFISLEAGYAVASFENYGTYSGLDFGGGIHYKF